MTPDQQRLTIWAGGALVVLVGAGWWLGNHADSLAATVREADDYHARYQKLYPAQGVAAPEAAQHLATLKDLQQQALGQAEARLVPELPAEYTVGDLNAATARVNEDYATLKKKAQREKVTLADQLPLRDGLDPDGDKRSLQLAQLYLVRSVLETCMVAGVPEISAVECQKPYQDASGTYAVIPVMFKLRLGFEATEKLLEELRQAHDRGIGLGSLELSQDDNGSEQLTLIANLITVNPGSWKLGGAEPTGKGAPIRKTLTPKPRAGG
jgi:hypothetical protein